ncbi:MAG TPA: ATP-dependent Clp protease ATP-binding subunit, partial [Solirubrobacteraceae bacterium]
MDDNVRSCDACGERPAAVQVRFATSGERRDAGVCDQCARDMMSGQGGGLPGFPEGVSGGLLGQLFGGGAAGASAQAGTAAAPDGPAQGTRRQRPQTAQRRSQTPALDHFGHDLTADARSGRIDPVIGRDREVEQVVEILSRRRKNNAVLIGEAGVGKTAIAEGLALRIAEGKVPESLHRVRVVALDLAGMVAG